MLALLVILAILNSPVQSLMSAYPHFPYTAAYFSGNLPIMEYFYKFSLNFALFPELMYSQSIFQGFKLHPFLPIASVRCTAWGSRGRTEFPIMLGQCKIHSGSRGTEPLIRIGQVMKTFLGYQFHEKLLILVNLLWGVIVYEYVCSPI